MLRLLPLLLLLSCNSKPIKIHGIAMNMPYSVTIEDKIDQTLAKTIIESTFEEIDNSVNHWNPDSNISLGKVDDHILKLDQLSQNIASLSQNRFNPKLGGLIQRWKTALSNREWLSSPSVEEGVSDFDGISKGYTVDLISERLKEIGCKTFLVQWAGEGYGTGREWKILIPHPNSSQPIDIVQLRDKGIATSGDYMQQWSVNGKIYSHIIDPQTLEPIEVREGRLTSVTVVASSCAKADGLATAAMLFDKDEFETWNETMEDVAFWAVTR